MEKKNSKLFIVVALLLIVGIGTSFAYFLVGVTFKGEGATANVSTGKLPLVEYDAGSSTLSKDGLTPKDIISKTFKVIVTPTKDIKEATYRIFIDITSNTFVKCMEDNYDEFENACELNAEELVYRLKDSSGTVIKTGNLIGKTGQIEIARETKMQDIKTEYNYTIEVEFKDTGKDQNHNTNKIFNASLNVEYAEEVITVDDIIARSNAKSEVPDFSKIAPLDEIKTEVIVNSKITSLTNITNDPTYPFNYDNNGTFTSTNKVDGTTSSITFNVESNVENVAICYEVSSEEGYDEAVFYVDGEEKGRASGENSNCIEIGNITPSNTIKVEYTKDSSSESGNDEVIFYLSNDYEKKQTGSDGTGVYATPDGMYGNTTYYWRGAATTNHVIFANKCWRIVRINGDKTMRLIYNGTPTSGTCADFGSGAVVYSSTTSDRYYATSDGQYNNASYVGWTYSLGSQRTLAGTASNAKTQTENWYKDTSRGNLTAYESKIADGKYCNDRNMKSGSSFPSGGTGSTTQYYAGYGRLIDSKAPTFDCPSGDVYTLKVGAITADEVAFAGGVYGQNNGSYYLKGDNHYWTMSPYFWNGSAVVFFVDSFGGLNNAGVHDISLGLRPVINLKADTLFAKDGLGTLDKPYICL